MKVCENVCVRVHSCVYITKSTAIANDLTHVQVIVCAG